MIENSKRRRGISLSHHTQASSTHPQALDKSVYAEAQPTTRLLYPRYQLQSPSRHASAPKAKVHFAYPLHPTAVTALRAPIRNHELPFVPDSNFVPTPPGKYFIGALPPPSKNNETTNQVRMSESLPLPQQQREEPKSMEDSKVSQTERSSPIPQKYSSFQQCKQAIGRRLFGAGTIVRRENVLQETDRSNRWIVQQGKPSKQEQEYKVIKQPEIRVIEPPQNNLSFTSIQDCVKEVVKTCESVAEPPKKRQLNIDHEVFKIAGESKPAKENAPPLSSSLNPSSKKEGRKGRDPLKLQEMEKRLMEIIKICDDNLS